MKKNFALAIALSVALSATTPVFAFTRDGGSGRDRQFNPIERIVKIIKKLFHPGLLDEWGQPHP
jgi:hypothetical protein